MAHAPSAAPETFNPLDPHGFHKGHHHGHVIMRAATLRNVLLALLAFTVLTVAATRVEIWLTGDLGLTLPRWVNIVVAMSIATVKAAIVCLFFMQLKYDNPVNSFIFLFCLFAVGLFLGFSAMDLGSRAPSDPFEKGEIVAGGTGLGSAVPNYARPREELIAEIGIDEYNRLAAEAHAHAGHGHATHHADASTSNRSVRRQGLTPGLFDEHADDHAPHDAHAAPAGGSGH